MPSAAARSPRRSGPACSTVERAASWVGVRPAISWRRSRRDSRARATRSRVTSITPFSAPIVLAPAVDGITVVSRAMQEDYAVTRIPHTVGSWGSRTALSPEGGNCHDHGAERVVFDYGAP